MRHTPSWRATSTTAYLVVCPKMWTRAPRVIRLFGSALVWKGEILSKREPLAVNNAAVWIYIIQIDWLLMNFTYFAFFLARPSFGNSGVEFYRGHWGSKTIDRIHVLCVYVAADFRIYHHHYIKCQLRQAHNASHHEIRTYIVRCTCLCDVYNTLKV